MEYPCVRLGTSQVFLPVLSFSVFRSVTHAQRWFRRPVRIGPPYKGPGTFQHRHENLFHLFATKEFRFPRVRPFQNGGNPVNRYRPL